MGIIKTIKNLSRLSFNNILLFVNYKFKKKTKKNLSKKDLDLSLYYNYLVKHNGFLVKENTGYYLTNFKNLSSNLIKLRKRPSSDFNVFYQIFECNEYLPVVNICKSNFLNLQNYSLNIIDAGSNIGLTSLFFIKHFEKATIIAVEPDKDNFELLNYNLKQKDNYKFVKINGAVWSSNTKIKVVNDFRDKSDWSFRVQESKTQDSLQAYTINDLMTQHNFNYIDILKIDIEGAEKEIFTSQFSDLNFLDKTKCIAIEIHDEFECRNEINLILENYGFELNHEGELTIGINKKLIDLNV